MKKLAIISLALLSSVAFASKPVHGGGGGSTQACAVCETGDINVGAPQIQLTVL